MSEPDPFPSLPPPRWRASGSVDPFMRNLMLFGVGIVGMMAGCMCCWTGLVHDALEEVMDRDSTTYEPTSYQVPYNPDDELIPGAKPPLEVRQSLRPMPDPASGKTVDDEPPPSKRPKPRGVSEKEMFGVE